MLGLRGQVDEGVGRLRDAEMRALGLEEGGVGGGEGGKDLRIVELEGKIHDLVEITEEMGARVEEVTSEMEERQIQFNSGCQILEDQLEKKDFRIDALEGQVSEYNKRNLFLEKETVALKAATQEQEVLNYDLQQNFDEILADNKTLA